MNSKTSLKDKFSLSLRGYKIIHRLVPGLITSTVLNAMFSASIPFINILMSAIIIDAIAAGKDLNRLIFLAILTALLNVAVTLISSGLLKLRDYYGSKFWIVQEKPLKDKIQALDYELVEDMETHLKIERLRVLRASMGYGLPRLYFSSIDLIEAFFKIIYSASLLSVVFTSFYSRDPGAWAFIYSPISIAAVLVLIIINITAGVFFSKNTAGNVAKIFSGFEHVNRLGNYYMENLFNYRAGKDIKLYRLSEPINKELDNFRSLSLNLMRKFQLTVARNNSLLAVINTGITGLIYIFVALKALFGSFGIGSIVQCAGALIEINIGISSFTEAISMLGTNTRALKLLFEFLDSPDLKYSGTLPVEKRDDRDYELEFKNISFKYPKTDTYVLKNLNLKLKVGERMAIVGMNGSGKTTMIKLLCRLYDPTEGEITLNGINIKKYSYSEYISLFSMVFQDFKLFSFSLGQNVAGAVDYDKGRVEQCLKESGFGYRLSTMPKGTDSCLYKDFEEDGIEISGGEAQKIALARALYKDAPFIVLDEPTAALDPISEFEIYSKFNEIVGDKTAIYISHRLSSCRFCNNIAVFDEGRLIQQGSHQELLSQTGSKYHQLWNAQSQYYRS